MTAVHARAPVRIVADVPRAGVLLKPLRLRVLREAQTPSSATAIAARLGLPRQQVNYHVRELARAGFLRRAGRRQRRGLVEQNYVVSARAFVLAPEVLGALGTDHAPDTNTLTAAYLLTLAGRIQHEVGRGHREAEAQGKRLPVLSLDSEIGFETAAQRASFADALTQAVTRVIAEHTSTAASDHSRVTRRFRLALACYPIPASSL